MEASESRKVRSTLLVDDSEGDLIWAKRILDKTGLYPYVFTASHGEAALEFFLDYEKSRVAHPGRFPPVLIFLDINMPRMGGFEFLERFEAIQSKFESADKPSIVLMLSTSGLEADRSRAAAFPSVRDFVTKPLSEEKARELASRWGEFED